MTVLGLVDSLYHSLRRAKPSTQEPCTLFTASTTIERQHQTLRRLLVFKNRKIFKPTELQKEIKNVSKAYSFRVSLNVS